MSDELVQRLTEIRLERELLARRKETREREARRRERAVDVGAQVHARRTWVALVPTFTNTPDRS